MFLLNQSLRLEADHGFPSSIASAKVMVFHPRTYGTPDALKEPFSDLIRRCSS